MSRDHERPVVRLPPHGAPCPYRLVVRVGVGHQGGISEVVDGREIDVVLPAVRDLPHCLSHFGDGCQDPVATGPHDRGSGLAGGSIGEGLAFTLDSPGRAGLGRAK